MQRLWVILFWHSLSIWVGGMIILSAVVAPALFSTLPTRALAGESFGAILRAFSCVQLACGLLCAGSLAGLVWKGPKPLLIRIQMALIGLMLSLALAHDLYVLPEAHANRENPEKFAVLHRISVFLFGANILLGLSAISVSSVVKRV